MARIEWKPSALLAPLPAVLVTCGTMAEPNALTIAWTGITCSQPPRTYISVKPERWSHELISKTGEFVINLTTSDVVRKVDYCGVKSGRSENKIANMKIELLPSKTVSAPTAAFAPAAIECRVFQVVPLGSHDMFLADITAVTVDEAMLDEAGKLHLERAGLITYCHGAYHSVGKRLGTFGWTVKKRPTRPQKPKQ